jgi:F-type H+-transporting ATPase subunit a
MSTIRNLPRKWIAAIAIVTLILLALGLYGAFGSAGRNSSFQPQNEFRLDPWIEIMVGPVDLSINKAVMYVLIACVLTIGAMMFVANRMQARPNRIQTLVEASYDLTRNQITRANMPEGYAARWFAFIATLFFFIWISNLIGYIPLPINTEHKTEVFGLFEIPSFALYAATANLSVPLVLTLLVWILYHVQGIAAKGPVAYFKGWIPQGTPGPMKPVVFVIEVISQFVRIISLSVRLFANILAGHLLILFMGGGLVVLLGVAAIGVITMPMAIAFYVFEVGLVATLQAFIFATLTSIYLGEAVESH